MVESGFEWVGKIAEKRYVRRIQANRIAVGYPESPILMGEAPQTISLPSSTAAA